MSNALAPSRNCQAELPWLKPVSWRKARGEIHGVTGTIHQMHIIPFAPTFTYWMCVRLWLLYIMTKGLIHAIDIGFFSFVDPLEIFKWCTLFFILFIFPTATASLPHMICSSFCARRWTSLTAPLLAIKHDSGCKLNSKKTKVGQLEVRLCLGVHQWRQKPLRGPYHGFGNPSF